MDINARLKEISDLDSFLIDKNKTLHYVISSLGWSENSMLDENKIQCPNDSNHWVHESALPRHLEMCNWVKQGYLKEEKEKLPPSSQFFYQKATSVNSLKIDKKTLANILIEKGLMEAKPLDECPDVPQTIDRWTVVLNPEQRLAVYDYIIKEGKSDNRSRNVTMEDLMFDFEKKDDQGDKPKTQLELMAEHRDYKRRRQSYRAKNVHITKKSYTEVMKEVIENQITYLAETRKRETADKREDAASESTTNDRDMDDTESLHEDEQKESRHYHHSHRKHSRSPSAKRRKHKRERSRSRSKSRHHKKSHHKHKKSHS